MLVANIEPVQYFNETAVQVGAAVMSYDMVAQNCTLYWALFNGDGSVIYNDKWDVTPISVLESWGTDDSILLQALADEKGFVITSFI